MTMAELRPQLLGALTVGFVLVACDHRALPLDSDMSRERIRDCAQTSRDGYTGLTSGERRAQLFTAGVSGELAEMVVELYILNGGERYPIDISLNAVSPSGWPTDQVLFSHTVSEPLPGHSQVHIAPSRKVELTVGRDYALVFRGGTTMIPSQNVMDGVPVDPQLGGRFLSRAAGSWQPEPSDRFGQGWVMYLETYVYAIR